ncbi:hypothetical protein TREES_T100005428 [Tupaia chinensis]|uniref:Uncharacterized protein n=1 Tax=Tupaia chinensis TaxID=246437 RepID=L9KR96_TUPCH|nr:hypothetical protein TREES_T100005428 [Tupaia chinensis]
MEATSGTDEQVSGELVSHVLSLPTESYGNDMSGIQFLPLKLLKIGKAIIKQFITVFRIEREREREKEANNGGEKGADSREEKAKNGEEKEVDSREEEN